MLEALLMFTLGTVVAVKSSKGSGGRKLKILLYGVVIVIVRMYTFYVYVYEWTKKL